MIESVAVRQRGAYDFQTHYDNLCALQNSCPLPAVKAHLPESVLDINGDRIRATDWVPVLNTIRINKTLEFAAVRSYYQQTLEDEKNKYNVKRKTPAIRSKEITYRLCKALKECLCVTPSLTCIELQGLPLRERDLAALAKGLSKNATLKHLSLEYSMVGDEGLDIVCKGVKNSTSVSSLNFTGCGVSWKGAETLAKVIKHQAMKRHNEAWQDSLRYRRPDLDRMSGVRRITINSNPMLSDQGALALAEALKDDLWLKALDLQQCGISDTGAKALLDVLRYNTTIVVLDVRQNPMIDQDVIRNIMEQVMINSNGQDTEYKWIKNSPPQDPGKVRIPKKKRTKTLQSSFGKKTTIKVTGGTGRRRTKSAGAVSRPLQPFNAESVRPGPGMPWRTAMRADRYRGYPPEQSPSKTSMYDMNESSSPMSSPKHHTSIVVDYSEATDADETTDTFPRGKSRSAGNLHQLELSSKNFKQIQVEMEELRRRCNEESEARSNAEERVLELTVENRRLRQELDDAHARGGLLDDDKVLESIEASFQQFHAFLDLLKDAGLGELITMAGLDQRQMPNLGRSESRVGPSVSFAGDLTLPSGSANQGRGHISIQQPSDSHPAFSQSDSERGRGNGPAAGILHNHVVPQNYQDSQDPIMRGGPVGNISSDGQHSKFDELYEKVWKETEGAISQARGDSILETSRLSNTSVSSRGLSREPSNTSLAGPTERLLTKKAHVEEGDILSDHSQRSHHSQLSQHSLHSQHSKHSQGSIHSIHSQASAHSIHSQASAHSIHSQASAHSIHSLQSIQGLQEVHSHNSSKESSNRSTVRSRSAGKENQPQQVHSSPEKSDKEYSYSFEKSQSDISEDIDEIHEDIEDLIGSDDGF